MATITLRLGKGSPLTNSEVDANFTNINTELGTKADSSALAAYLTTATAASTYLPLSGGTTTGQTILANAFRFYTGGTDGSTLYGDFRTNPATGNSIISAKTGGLYFNYDHGTGGVLFCNGANGVVGTVDASGNANFIGAITQNGSQVLTAGNYNSYSPTLTGTGASGTWGISITGNAATVTNGLVSTGSYANPSWITSLDASKLTGTLDNARVNGGTYSINISGTAATATSAPNYLPLAGGTLTGNLAITTVSTSGYNTALFQGNWSGAGYWGLGSDGIHTIKFDQINTLGGTQAFAGASDITLKLGTKTVLDSSNYNSYSPTLTGTGASGTWAINITGSAATATDSTKLPLAGGTLTGLLNINSTGDNQLVLTSADTWTGIGFDDASASAADYIWHNGVNSTFAIGGGGSNVAGKKLHIHGGVTIGASYANTANPTNGLNVEGAIQQAGNQVLHAGNYNSYAPTLTGTGASGTWGINISGNAATATTATNQSGGTVSATTGSFSQNITVGTGTAVDPSNVGGFAAGQITEGTTGFSAPGIVIGSSSGQHGAIVYGSNTMYFGTENGSDNTMNTRATLSSSGAFNATGAITQNGSQVLTAANYNSYAPTLTGTGASGTWNISITGSAASVPATSVTNLYSPNGATVVSGDASTAMPSTANSLIHTLGTGPSGNDGHILGMSWTGATVYGAQIWLDTDPTNRMAIRSRSNSGVWNSWSEVLTALNYNSYAPTLTGTGASGTWGISITGSAGTAGSVDYNNLTNKTGGTGTYTTSGDYRAPIFYDSNDTGYYADLNGQSYMRYLRIAGDWGGSVDTAQLGIRGTYPSITFRSSTSNSVWLRHMDGAGDIQHYYASGGLDSGGWTVRHSMFTDGTFTSIASHRAPVFYDSDNTAYYTNPASATSGSFAGFVGIGNSYGSDDGGWGSRLNVGGGPHARLDVRCANDGIVTTMYSHAGQGMGKMGMTSNHPLALMAQSSVIGGYVYGGSIRAPIFYDSDDTGYYVDPNSNSRLSSISVPAGNPGFVNAARGSSYGYSASYGTIIYGVTSGNVTPCFNVDPIANASGSFNGNGSEVMFRNGVQFISPNSANTSYNNYFVLQDGYAAANNSFRAPIFYDSNDSGYYGDFANISRTNRMGANYFQYHASVEIDSGFGLYFDSGLSTAYAIFRQPGAWSGTYPDLRIAFHTGIQIGANSSYQGVRFYTDYDMSSQVMSVNNGSDPLGGGNVYVNGSLQAGSSLRAPLFYDSDNTAYYLDPNSGTSLNAAGNLQYGSGGANTGSFIYHGAGAGDYGVVRFYQAGSNNQTIHVFSTAWQSGTLQSTAAGSINLDGANGTTIGSWTNVDMWIDKSGNSQSRTSSRAPVFYDSNDTAYYTNPAGASVFSDIRGNGGNLQIAANNVGRNTKWRQLESSTDIGISFYNAADTWLMQLYANAGTEYGFLNGNWASWDIRKVPSGNLFLNNQSTYYINGTEIYYNRVYGVTDIRSPVYYDGNNTAYYVDPNSASLVYTLRAESQLLVGGGSDLTINADQIWRPNGGQLHLQYSAGGNIQMCNGGGYAYAVTSFRAPIFYDTDNTGFYLNPNGTSVLSGLTMSNEISTPGISGYARYFPPTYAGGVQSNPQVYFNENIGLKVAMTGVPFAWCDTLWINGYAGADVPNMCALHTARNGQARMWISSQSNRGTAYGTQYEVPVIGANYGNEGSLYAGAFVDSGNTGYYLDLNGASNVNATVTGAMYFRSDRNTTSDSPPLQAYSSGGGGAIMAFHRAAAYAINFGLDSDNVIRFGGWSAGANRLQMDMSGNLTMAGNVTAYSDERLKKDWALLPSNFIENLAKVKSGTYTRIDSEERQVGVSAQGLQEFLADAVQTDAAGMLSVNYGGAALASAVELAKEVVDLRNRVAQLESLINKLIGD